MKNIEKLVSGINIQAFTLAFTRVAVKTFL
jgi:hypothetical protein